MICPPLPPSVSLCEEGRWWGSWVWSLQRGWWPSRPSGTSRALQTWAPAVNQPRSKKKPNHLIFMKLLTCRRCDSAGGFSHQYWCVCDSLGVPFREEVQWVGTFKLLPIYRSLVLYSAFLVLLKLLYFWSFSFSLNLLFSYCLFVLPLPDRFISLLLSLPSPFFLLLFHDVHLWHIRCSPFLLRWQ